MSFGRHSLQFDELLDILTHGFSQDNCVIVLQAVVKVLAQVSKLVGHLLEAVHVSAVVDEAIRYDVPRLHIKHYFVWYAEVVTRAKYQVRQVNAVLCARLRTRTVATSMHSLTVTSEERDALDRCILPERALTVRLNAKGIISEHLIEADLTQIIVLGRWHATQGESMPLQIFRELLHTDAGLHCSLFRSLIYLQYLVQL